MPSIHGISFPQETLPSWFRNKIESMWYSKFFAAVAKTSRLSYIKAASRESVLLVERKGTPSSLPEYKLPIRNVNKFCVQKSFDVRSLLSMVIKSMALSSNYSNKCLQISFKIDSDEI